MQILQNYCFSLLNTQNCFCRRLVLLTSKDYAQAKTTLTTARTSSENRTSRFCNHLSIISNHYACKMCCRHHGMKLESALPKLKINLSSSAHVVHTTAKQAMKCPKMHVQRVQKCCFLLFNVLNYLCPCRRRGNGCL